MRPIRSAAATVLRLVAMKLPAKRPGLRAVSTRIRATFDDRIAVFLSLVLLPMLGLVLPSVN